MIEQDINITDAHYLTSDITNENSMILCIIEGQKSAVPLDPANRHYAEILRQVEAGTLTIQEAE